MIFLFIDIFNYSPLSRIHQSMCRWFTLIILLNNEFSLWMCRRRLRSPTIPVCLGEREVREKGDGERSNGEEKRTWERKGQTTVYVTSRSWGRLSGCSTWAERDQARVCWPVGKLSGHYPRPWRERRELV